MSADAAASRRVASPISRAGWSNMNKGLIWTIVGVLLIIALVIWIMRAV
jgi:hypothetical protein